MLAQLTSEVHELLCIDEVDETSGTLKWNKKAAELLEKFNRDCNMTAGLVAKLSLAVGARVLRHNIDTQTGLVNGAIGTVLSISVNQTCTGKTSHCMYCHMNLKRVPRVSLLVLLILISLRQKRHPHHYESTP